MSLAAIAIFAVAFFLIATEKFNRVAVVLFAAAAMTVLGIVSGQDIFFSEHAGIDWHVIFLLLGMMIIVSIIRQTGVFEFLAIWAAKKSRGRPYRLMVMLLFITAVASPFLDNVTTVLLVAPVTIMVCQRLDLPPVPYLIAEVLASNIGGAATLIGDPPNIIIASRGGLTFNDFLIHMTPIVAFCFVAFVLLARLLFRRSFVYHPEKVAEVMALNEKAAIKDVGQLVRSLIVLGLVIIGFGLHAVVDIEPSIVALLGAGAMILVSGTKPEEYLADVEWPTLVFFMGLFVMVGALVNAGVIASIGEWAADVFAGNYFGAASALVFGSAVLGAFFDNIPYAATMAPIVEGLVAQAPDASTGQALWWAFALGADFGGNGTAVAASANIVVLGIAARNGRPISFWEFTKYGIVTTAFTSVLAWLYVWLRYFT